MAAVTWTGGSLQNVWVGTPADRFNDYAPSSLVVGQRRRLLATGAPRVWKFREGHTATVVIRDIARTDLALALALQLHLSDGGTVSIDTGDTGGRVYPNCALAGDEAPAPVLDATTMRYSMELPLLNLDGTPLVIVY